MHPPTPTHYTFMNDILGRPRSYPTAIQYSLPLRRICCCSEGISIQPPYWDMSHSHASLAKHHRRSLEIASPTKQHSYFKNICFKNYVLWNTAELSDGRRKLSGGAVRPSLSSAFHFWLRLKKMSGVSGQLKSRAEVVYIPSPPTLFTLRNHQGMSLSAQHNQVTTSSKGLMIRWNVHIFGPSVIDQDIIWLRAVPESICRPQGDGRFVKTWWWHSEISDSGKLQYLTKLYTKNHVKIHGKKIVYSNICVCHGDYILGWFIEGGK